MQDPPRAGRPLGARYESTKGFTLPDREVLRPAAFSQIHDQPNTDSANPDTNNNVE